MALRVIDKITEEQDKEDPPHDWRLLATPLAEALKIDAKEDLSTLYVRQSSNNFSKLDIVQTSSQNIKTLPSDIIDVRATLTTHRSQPVVLVGEAGVGKTSWLRYFSEIVINKDDSISFHYDQKVDFHLPIISSTTSEVHFEKIFWYFLFDKVQTSLKSRGITGTALTSVQCENIIEYSNPELIKLFKLFEETIESIYAQFGITLFILIDNIDQFDSSLQKKAFELAVWLSSIQGVLSFVALRPDTMNDKMFTENVHDPLIYYISPPRLEQLLESRLNYLWSDAGEKRLYEIRSILSDNAITNNLSYTGMLDRSDFNLKQFHRNIKNLLCGDNLLENTLYSLHNGNLRNVSKILSAIILTKYFSEQFREGTIEGTTDESIPSLKKPEKLITAYLRGVYKHYRAGTSVYPVSDISLLSDLPDNNDNAILGIRILQALSARKSVHRYGVFYNELLGVLESILYNEQDIRKALVMLVRRGFIAETVRQTHIESSDEFKTTDRFRLTPTGEFVFFKLLYEYAFRYCEAIADVSPHPRLDGKTWGTDKSFISMVENAFGILEFFVKSAEIERNRLKEATIKNNDCTILNRLKNEFYNGSDSSEEVLAVMAKECFGRARFFSKQGSNRANYDGHSAFKHILEVRIPNLQGRIHRLHSFE